ncbi:DUF2510 domain-containing protein [Streptomyces sp. MZ04]|uniref:DUF2510 domain-containing protein n=1 Tax=Streptomyces sp. MZ04 TaxID=2559236 RepID=UPI00107E8CF3|nr:DUF2510 domain-containing protein [Streptomyces sp. MZ04]TGB08534.1 DUF2510 domain-containing protein [Streptomyces sp. MZ04]
MTQVTPPGWYPDPGQSADGPRTERWWDGNVWTDQVRAVGAAAGFGGAPPAAPQGYPPSAPGYPAYPAYPTGPRRGLRTAIAIGVAVVVLAGIGGGVYFLTSDDDKGDSDSAAKSPSPSAPSKPGPEEPQDPEQSPGGPSEAPPSEEGYATDVASGISLPVPDKWTGQSGQRGGASVSVDPYPCPRETSKTCTRGGAYSSPAEALKIDAKTAEAAAKADIAVNAKGSYGGKTYGKVTSHKELASKAVTVAGQKGYLVRWKAVTEKSDDGYVQSLAFPSPSDKSMLVIVRFGIDVNDKSPKLSVMDEITKGIKAAPGGGGGNGQEV